MKKTFFIVMFMLSATVVFGAEIVEVWTSTGVYWVTYNYDGKNQGQSRADWLLEGPETGGGDNVSAPNQAHWECVRYILCMYTPTRGDTFVIGIKKPGGLIALILFANLLLQSSITTGSLRCLMEIKITIVRAWYIAC